MRFHKFDEKPKDYRDDEIGAPIVINTCASTGYVEPTVPHGRLMIAVTKKEAAKLKLEYVENHDANLVWVKKSALDLAKESIRRKEETRMERAKNE